MVAVGLLLLGLLAAWVPLVQLLGQQGRLLPRLEALEEQLSLGSHGHAEDQPEGLPVRSQIPSFRLLDVTGQHRTWRLARLAIPLAIRSLSPDRSGCNGLDDRPDMTCGDAPR
jgi:hypothetical protein